jgi:hypothetical protein
VRDFGQYRDHFGQRHCAIDALKTQLTLWTNSYRRNKIVHGPVEFAYLFLCHYFFSLYDWRYWLDFWCMSV